MRRPLVLPLLVVAGIAGGGAPAQSPGPRIDLVKVEGVVDPALSGYVREEIRSAARDEATVVLQIDSRGSYGDEAVRLGEFIRGAGIPVVAWVGPAGSRLEGGALFLAYSSSLVTMAPGAGLGPARPFDLGTSVDREDPVRVARSSRRLLALAEASEASADGLDLLLRGEALAAGPALDAGAVALVAGSAQELIAKLDGRTVQTARGAVTLATQGESGGSPATVRFHEPGPVTRVLHAAATPTAVYVLLVLGLWGIAFELTQPGVGAAGIAGVLAIGFAAYELTVIPVAWVGLGLIAGGLALQGLDVVIRRVAWLTALGAAAFGAGSFLAWRGVAPAIDLPPWLIALFLVGGVLFFGFALTVAMRSRERVRTAQLGLVGLLGEVRSDLDPEGGVYVKGALWRARSMDGRIPKGRRVRVRGVDGLILRVEEEPD